MTYEFWELFNVFQYLKALSLSLNCSKMPHLPVDKYIAIKYYAKQLYTKWDSGRKRGRNCFGTKKYMFLSGI